MKFPKVSVALSAAALTALSFAPVYAQQQRGRPATNPRPAGQGNPNRPERPAQAERRGERPADRPARPPRAEFVDRIAERPKLVARLQALLPEGMTLEQAADGFRNQGQFISALHVSKNLNIPFDQLKDSMTGPDAKSLGQSIRELRPAADTDAAVSTAEQQAAEDEKVTSQ